MSNEELPGKQQKCTIERVTRLGYLLFLPQGYSANPDQRWPLILYLHGAGERGDDLELVKIHGIPKIVEQQPDFPFITVSPQCPGESWWWEHHLMLKALLEEILARYDVDETRVYLTGNSMGGFGAWSLSIAYPEMFAAIAPICGGGIAGFAPALKNVPVWAFHGAEDDVVNPEISQQMVDALRACGGDVKFTLYPQVGHDSWTQTYDNPELYEWFLAYRCQSR